MLALFLTTSTAKGGAAWIDRDVFRVTGIFGGMAFTLPLFGGWIASRYWGNELSAKIGSVISLLGYLCIALYVYQVARMPPVVLLLALALTAIGTGFFKPAISGALGNFYQARDNRRESGYILFMVAISTGTLVGGAICGALSESFGWAYAFAAPPLAMVIAALALFIGKRFLAERNSPSLISSSPAGPVPLTAGDRSRLTVIFIFSALNVVYIAIYFQCYGVINVFVERSIDRQIYGMTFPAVWSFNILSIAFITLSFFSTRLWLRLSTRGANPNVIQKQTAGFVFLSLGFFVLAYAANLTTLSPTGKVSLLWLVLAYTVFSIADVCTQPIQLGAAGQYAPRGYASAMIGVWILSTGIGSFLSGFIGEVGAIEGLTKFLSYSALVLISMSVVAWISSRRWRAALQSTSPVVGNPITETDVHSCESPIASHTSSI